MHRRRVVVALGALVAALLPVVVVTPAAAEPATNVSYPTGSSATTFSGSALDMCAAPPLASVQAWNASGYRAIGVYVGGPNRTCAQPNLTASWVVSVTRLGWRLLPVYMGRQAPCSDRVTSVKITPSLAASQGTAAATDAAVALAALGMRPGSAVYADMEGYATSDSACRGAVLTYLSAWTRELHRRGYLSGVYAGLLSGALHLSQVYGSAAYARPDALWVARWDGSTALTGWAGIPNTQWTVHQRLKQYRGDHVETWGAVTLEIDSNRVDAPVATVALAYTVAGASTLNARTGPSPAYPVAATYRAGTNLAVVCQTPGSVVGTTAVWDRLGGGTYVSDYYVSTPSNTGYSAPLPRCRYPYQVTSSTPLNKRSGPGSSYAARGSLQAGALAWTYCQRAGSKVGTTSVWDRLDDGTYVSDYYVATPSNTTYSRPVPRC